VYFYAAKASVMNGLFINPDLQKEIEEKGFLPLPFFTANELAKANKLYQELHPDGTPPQMRNGIHMTYWCSDREYKVYIKEQLLQIVTPAANRLFTHFRCVNPVFIVKIGDVNTTFPIHQDWSIVDETQYQAYNVWIPLHDVNEHNGGLWMVKGSHKLANYVRGAGVLFPDLSSIEEYIKPIITPVPLKAGDAVFFYHRTIHGSPPNLTASPRIAVSFSVLPKEVSLQIYFQKNEESELEAYEVEDNFIYNYENVRDDTPNIPPIGNRVKVLKGLSAQVITLEVFMKAYYGQNWESRESGGKAGKNIIALIKKWLNLNLLGNPQ